MGNGSQQKRSWVVLELIAGRRATLQDITFLGLESVSLKKKNKNLSVQPRPPKFSQICWFRTMKRVTKLVPGAGEG